MQLEAKMKQILEDYAPLLNADVVEGQIEEDAEELTPNEVSSSSKRKKSGKQSVH